MKKIGSFPDGYNRNLSDLIVAFSYNVTGGIGVGVTSSMEGLYLVCESYKNMRTGDLISIYLHETDGGLAGRSVVDKFLLEEDVGKNVIIIVPPENIKAGWFDIYYTVTHADSGLSDISDVKRLWIKLDVPGGYDPNPSTVNINENFAIPSLPTSIVDVGVDAEQAKKGVPVVISPYINMRVRDRINLSWGGVVVTHTVSEEEVDQSVVISVSESTILKAGDSEKLLISYEVRDEVNNYSRWSPSQAIFVDASGYRLAAPIVKGAANNTLDIDKLNGQDVIVQVVVSSANFSINDSVNLRITGRTPTGDIINHEEYLVVSQSPSVLEFRLPNALIRQLSQGYFIASYVLIKAADNSRFLSWNITIDVKANISTLLEKPLVTEACANTLDASLGRASVVIPLFPSMSAGAKITLFWAGVTANSDSYTYTSTWEITSISIPVKFEIEESAIQILAGGRVAVYYQFTSTDDVVLISDKLYLDIIQILDMPAVPASTDGVLAPDDITLFVLVTVPPWAGMVTGDRVDLFWKAPIAAGSLVDWTLISASSVGNAVNFRIAKKYVELNINNTIDISYQITRSTGVVIKSESLLLRIRDVVQQDLPLPLVPEATGSVLNLSQLPPNISLRIPVYPEMAIGDLISAYLQGLVGWQDEWPVSANSAGAEINFHIQTDIISANNESEVMFYYEVNRFNGKRDASPNLALFVTSDTVSLSAPAIDEVTNGVLSPDALSRYAKLRISPYLQMTVGDTISVFLNGVENWEDYTIVSANTLNKDLVFYIPKEIIVASLNSSFTVTYQVNGHILLSSERLVIRVEHASLVLAAPAIVLAPAGVLDPSAVPVSGLEVSVPHWENMVAGDGVTLRWGPNYRLYLPVNTSMVGQNILFLIPANVVRALNGQTIAVDYIVTQLDGTENFSPLLTLRILELILPAPWIRQATDNVLNIGTIAAGADIVIPMGARLQAGDTVELVLKTRGGAEQIFSRKTEEADTGVDYQWRIAQSAFTSSVGGKIVMYYVIKREAQRFESPAAQYDVTDELNKTTIRILGARSAGFNYRFMTQSRYLVGLDNVTGEKIALSWRYDGDETATTTLWFRDSQPWKTLQVSSASETLQLRPRNISGNGDDVDDGNEGAMLAQLDSGEVVTWGSVTNGGQLPDFLSGVDTLHGFCVSSGAIAALDDNNSVVAWGDAGRGGSATASVQKLKNVVSLSAAAQAFSALLSTGKVVAWGNASTGGSVPANIASFNNIVKVVGTGGAFIALRGNNRLAAWGKSDYAGLLPVPVANLNKVKDIVPSYAACTALNADNTLVSWGSADYGGELPNEIKQLKDVSDIMASNVSAFVVKRTNGLLAAWGQESHGGSLPVDFATVTDVITIVATWSAFIALRDSGSVIAWGDQSRGGLLPREIAQLTDIVQIATTAGACAALRANGAVVTWGDPLTGGNSSAVAGRLVNCQAIYSNSGAFTVLTADKHVISWGSSEYGGDNSNVSVRLDGAVSYYNNPE